MKLMKRNLLVFICLMAAIALIGVGCGSSDGADSSAAPLTKAQLIKQGDAICSKGQDEIHAAYREFTKQHKGESNRPLTRTEAEAAIKDLVLPALQKQAQSLDSLGVPKGDQGQVDAIVEGFERVVSEGEEDPAVLLDSTPLVEVGRLARKYGLSECGA
jgi:hypothetical protein